MENRVGSGKLAVALFKLTLLRKRKEFTATRNYVLLGLISGNLGHNWDRLGLNGLGALKI